MKKLRLSKKKPLASTIGRQSSLRKVNGQSGAILVLVAILVPVLIAVIALAVEVNYWLTAKERMQHFARLASLAAIEAYFAKKNDGGTVHQAEEAALHRVEQIASINKPVGIQDINDLDVDVIPGKWVTKETGSSVDCSNGTPCFKRNQSAVSAIQVKVGYNGGLTKLFGLFSGDDEVRVKSSAISAVVPRLGCFLIDISSSVTRNTHLLYSDPSLYARASEYAFSINYLGSKWDRLRWYYNGSIWQDGGVSEANRATAHNSLKEIGFAQRHYQSDYTDITPLTDNDYSVGDDNKKYHPDPNSGYHVKNAATYRIDTARISQNLPNGAGTLSYNGPEPLNSILKGVGKALESFRERQVVGDKACLIFFDDTLAWPRIINLTSLAKQQDYDYLRQFTPDNPSSSTSIDFLSQHWIFPVLQAKTNVYAALVEAFKQFDQAWQAEKIETSNFVVLIGDGINNCQASASGQSAAVCSNDYSTYKHGMSELKSFASSIAAQKGVPLHTILIGDMAGPHTVDIQKEDSSECYTDAELRAEMIPKDYVLGAKDEAEAKSSFENASASSPFFQVGRDIYDIAVATGGVFAPVRPVATGCVPTTSCNSTVPPTRVTHDPLCRPQAEQIVTYMEKIMGDNPYAVVQVE